MNGYYEDDFPFDNETEADLPRARNPMPDMIDEPDAWQAANAQLRAAWYEWRDRMRETLQRKFKGKPPTGWWSRNDRSFRDCCYREYGADSPEPTFISWRNKRCEELGRGSEADVSKQPWE